MTKSDKHFLLLQINDSLFPIGGYSHSYGLETYIQRGIVCDERSAKEYVENRLSTCWLYTDLLSLRLAYEAAAAGDCVKLDELEDKLDALRIPFELRDASKKLGSRFSKTVLQMGAARENCIFETYLQVRKGKCISHPCAYGVFCAGSGIALEEAMTSYLYAQASAVITNCVKTIPLSQSSGQKMLYSLFPTLDEILDKAKTCPEEMLGASAPGFDISCIQHAYLYSRLYMS